MTTFTRTSRTTPSRKRDRVSYERVTAYAIIDEALYCHVGFVVDGSPRVLPTQMVTRRSCGCAWSPLDERRGIET